jgi:hypothetical protein
MHTYKYNTIKYDLREHVRRAINAYDLEAINKNMELFTVNNDQSSPFHQMWYEYVDSDFGGAFLTVYKSFIKDHLAPLMGDFLYQTKPTIRFHLRDNVAVGGWHRDRDYNHNPKEINVFLPMTRAFGTNTMWIESEEGKQDFAPLESGYGQYTIFDGANLQHGNHSNTTSITRVSFDCRLLEKRYYQPGKRSVSQQKEFAIGDYWSEL